MPPGMGGATTTASTTSTTATGTTTTSTPASTESSASATTTGTTTTGAGSVPSTNPQTPGGVDPFTNMMTQMMNMMSQGNVVSIRTFFSPF